MKDVQHRLLKHTRAYYDSPDQAAPRNLTREMLQTLQGFQQTAPGYLALDQQFQPLRGQLTLDMQRQQMFGFDDDQGVHHPGILELGRQGTEYQRAGDISDVATYGPASTAAFLAANPFLADSLVNLSGRTQDSDILKKLNEQALEGISSGGALTPQEQRLLDQHSRTAFSARGNLHGNQSIASELFNRDAARRARLQQAQQLAGTVQGMNQNQNDFVGRASQIFGTTLSDPFQAILGRTSGSGSSSGGGGYPQQIGTGATLFDPLNPYAQDLYNTNFNAENANNIAEANANNAQTSAYITAATSLLGGLLSDKRIKKNIKKTGDKTPEGVDIYEWEYATDPEKKRYRGVLAQEQEKADPDSVLTDEMTGLKLIKREANTPIQRVEGKGRHRKYFNLVTGELEAAA